MAKMEADYKQSLNTELSKEDYLHSELAPGF
jgi:hypothetical protein